jgi:thiamine biosynthesis lipoprotein
MAALAACAPAPKVVTSTALDFMDTVSMVTLYERDASAAQRVFDACRDLDGLLDMRDPSSEISRLNGADGVSVPISSDTEALLRIGVEAARISDGLFDITVGTASLLWDFPGGVIPDKAALDAAVSHVGIDNLAVGDGRASITNGGVVDMGALAKGYALDIAQEILAGQGVANALVNLGGSVLALGVRPDGQPWRVGVQKPFGNADELLGVIEAPNIKVVTAGLYQRSFELDGMLYHHILDPRAGMPADTDVWSATIIADSGVWADAYSTICVLLGSRRAMALVEDTDGVECILALSDGTILTSGGIGAKVSFYAVD